MALAYDRLGLSRRRWSVAKPVRLRVFGRTLHTNTVNVAVAAAFAVMGGFVMYLAGAGRMTRGPGFQVAIGNGLTRVFVLPIVMNTAQQIRADMTANHVSTPFLLDDGTVSREYGTLGKGMHAGLPGHSFVLIDAGGVQRWYGEYASMYLSPADLLTQVRGHLTWYRQDGGTEYRGCVRARRLADRQARTDPAVLTAKPGRRYPAVTTSCATEFPRA